jgi:hypothetical protein
LKLRRFVDGSVLANVSAAILVGLSVSSVSLAETPIYEFRGFDSNSTCDDIKDREIRHGGQLSSYEKKEGSRLWAYYIDSYLFGFDTSIIVTCGSNRHATSIGYRVIYSDGMDLGDVFDRFYSEIAKVFGNVEIQPDSIGRSATFLCEQGFLIQLNLVQASTITAEGSVSLQEFSFGISSGVRNCEYMQ